MGALRIAGRYKCAPDLPDVSKCFRKAAQKIHAGDPKATLHGVVFDILVGSEQRVDLTVPRGLSSRSSRAEQPAFARWVSVLSVFAFAALQLRRTPRFALLAPRGCAYA